jgi:type IV pilus biogenesis protein CpaD/CtpE
MEPNFGFAVRQDIVAQIADPDARYRRAESPASNGVRAANTVERYLSVGTEAPPSSTTYVISTTGQSAGAPMGGK